MISPTENLSIDTLESLLRAVNIENIRRESVGEIVNTNPDIEKCHIFKMMLQILEKTGKINN